MRVQRHAPAAHYPRERPGTHCTGGWQGRSGRTENLAPNGVRFPDRPVRSQSLNRLSYPTHIPDGVIGIFCWPKHSCLTVFNRNEYQEYFMRIILKSGSLQLLEPSRPLQILLLPLHVGVEVLKCGVTSEIHVCLTAFVKHFCAEFHKDPKKVLVTVTLSKT